MQSESAPLKSKEARINIRTNSEDKDTIERAARLRGVKVSQFILKDAIERAERILEEEKTMSLSVDDQKAFVNAFLEMHQPTPYLKNAIDNYKKS